MILNILNILAAAGVIFLSYTAVKLDAGLSAEDTIKATTALSK